MTENANSGRAFVMVIPSRRGRDLSSVDQRTDGHIRIETYKGVGTAICIDLFDSAIQGANAAHLNSKMFRWSDDGASEATKSLQKMGFRVVVVIK